MIPLKNLLKKLLPEKLFGLYHLTLVTLAAIYYRFPAKKIKIIGITGTKGKTTTTEIINAILEQAGYKTAIASTLRFKIGADTKPNLLKMTMPGRFFLQKFISQAVAERCDYCLIEMTSEGTKVFRHKFIDLDLLLFTGITPEHIEAHGSYEKYVEAKLTIGRSLATSTKLNRAIIVNKDSKEAEKFLALDVPTRLTYTLADGKPYTINEHRIEFSFRGEVIKSSLIGQFNLANLIAGATVAYHLGIKPKIIKTALENFKGVAGRMEHIKARDTKLRAKQNFDIIVDYAHTPESLEQVYKTYPKHRKICVLGGTGGGRDKWKREVLGSIADNYCDEIILTNEDPYDENPVKIINDLQKGIRKHQAKIIIDRREAISEAIKEARNTDVVIITGKGTDPYIMGPHQTKLKWSDALVASEELTKHLSLK